MQSRKFVTYERSAQKEKEQPRVSYQPLSNKESYDSNFHNHPRYVSTSNILKFRQEGKTKFSDLNKSPSEAIIKTRQQYMKGSIARKKNDGFVSNLKSELQSLKMEVSKFTSKEKSSDSRLIFPIKSIQRPEEQEPDNPLVDGLNNYGRDISDTVSVTSEKIIDQPLRKLQSKFSTGIYDHTHYMELQIDLLKTELRNLKNKYNATKQQLKQKCEALQRKNEYLEVSLRRSDQALSECRKNLQIELQEIRFQLSRKIQQQYEEEQKKNEKLNQPVRDNLVENQLIQDKINKLYVELSEKTATISNLAIEMNQCKGQLEKKTFQLKKQVEKNSELSKQFQFSKREGARNKNLLDLQFNRKAQLVKTVESLKQKIGEMSNQISLQNEMANNSEQLEQKYSQQLQQYRENEEKLRQQNFQQQNAIKKMKQLNESHQQQIRHLKISINQFNGKIEQITKSLRMEKEKSMQMEQSYRKLLDQAKQSSQKKLSILQEQFLRYRERNSQKQISSPKKQLEKSRNSEVQLNNRIINKWKGQYKLLKIKYDQLIEIEGSKKQEIQTYYKNYKEYKCKNRILEMKNKVLSESANQYIQKIQKLQTEILKSGAKIIEFESAANSENHILRQKIAQMEEEMVELRISFENETEKLNQQQSYRKEIQKKLFDLNDMASTEQIGEQAQLRELVDRLRKRITQQDQKINKNIKELKTKENLIKQLKNQIRDMMGNQQKQFERYKNKEVNDCIQSLEERIMSTFETMKSESKKELGVEADINKQLINENAKMKAQIVKLKAKVRKIKDESKRISILYNTQLEQYQKIKDKIQIVESEYLMKYQEQDRVKLAITQNLKHEISEKNQQIGSLRSEVKKALSCQISSQTQNFEQALKSQIQSSKKMKEEIVKKNEEIYRIKDQNSILRNQLESLKSQFDILKLKYISEKKNIQIQFDVESQTLKNQVCNEQKKVSSLQQKIKIVIDENKKKDSFIHTYIMGKKLPANEREILSTFIKEYEFCLKGKQLADKLQTESQQLQKMTIYNFNLLKQIAEMKQRLSIYEGVQENSPDFLEEMESLNSPASLNEQLSFSVSQN